MVEAEGIGALARLALLARVLGSATRSLPLKFCRFMDVSRFPSLFARRSLTSIPFRKLGGGGGNRTLVLKYAARGTYMLILYFDLSLSGLLQEGSRKGAAFKASYSAP